MNVYRLPAMLMRPVQVISYDHLTIASILAHY